MAPKEESPPTQQTYALRPVSLQQLRGESHTQTVIFDQSLQDGTERGYQSDVQGHVDSAMNYSPHHQFPTAHYPSAGPSSEEYTVAQQGQTDTSNPTTYERQYNNTYDHYQHEGAHGHPHY